MAFAPTGADKCFEEGGFREIFQSFAKSSGIVMPVNVGSTACAKLTIS